MNSISHDWQPTASLELLLKRSQIVWSVRQFFHSRGFAEVQTPILGRDTVIDRHIDPMRVESTAVACSQAEAQAFYLQTSPEFSMKRLLAAGMQAIYSLGPVFRAGERGDFHNPEFTMLEWYRVGDNLAQGVQLLSELVQATLNCLPAQVTTYQAAFEEHAQLDPLRADVDELSAVAVKFRLGVDVNWTDDRDLWLDLLFSEVVQPKLGRLQPTIITHYPATQSALAKLTEDGLTAERFELFIHGIELANGYHELLAADELEQRNSIALSQRANDRKAPLPSTSRLIDAMRAGIPPCSGCALGLDRLIMVATQSQKIDCVIPFPIERA